MKKKFAILTAVLIVAALLAGCGKTTSPSDTASREAMKNLTDLAANNPNDPATAAKVMENYAQFGAQMELQEYEKAEAVDAPSGFPSSLIYGRGKVTESSDDSSDSYLNKSITIKTTEDIKTVKDFYKNLFSQTPWRITSQSSASDGASYDAKDAANIEASVDISSNPYSKILNIYVSYSGDIAE